MNKMLNCNREYKKFKPKSEVYADYGWDLTEDYDEEIEEGEEEKET